MILYHGTTGNRLKQINKEGLIPKLETNSFVRKNGVLIPSVCLTKSKIVASYFANRKSYTEKKGIPVICKIKTNNYLYTAIDNHLRKEYKISLNGISLNEILKIEKIKKYNQIKLFKFFKIK